MAKKKNQTTSRTSLPLDVLIDRPIESYVREVEALQISVRRTKQTAARMIGDAENRIGEAFAEMQRRIDAEQGLLNELRAASKRK
jgi:hypothetical protein